jgi:transposase
VTGWLTRHPKPLTESAAGHIRAFGEMLTKLRGQVLPAWIAAVRAENLPGLTALAASLEADLDAVTHGLTLRWNSGPVEGRVNHFKCLNGRCLAEPACQCFGNGCSSPPPLPDDGPQERGRVHHEI